MNSTHAIATGGALIAQQPLADILVYLSHWPLQPLTQPLAMSMAGVLIASGAWLWMLYRQRSTSKIAAQSTEVKP